MIPLKEHLMIYWVQCCLGHIYLFNMDIGSCDYSSAIMFKFKLYIYIYTCELFTCWRLYKLQRFDSIHEDFAFISKFSFCNLPNWQYDANTFKHPFKQTSFF